jgi:membrane protease YdiL (CAAX protease family)
MPTFVDLVLVFVLVVIAWIFEHVYFWPRLRAAVAADRPGARLWAYVRVVIGEWAFALMAIVIWNDYGRPWRIIGLSLPHGWRRGVAIGCVVTALALIALQLWSVLRLPIARRIAARPKLGSVAFALPRTPAEHRWFLVVSVTAGFCEELLYRGYLVWFFAPWIGYYAAMALAVVLFGIGHSYQGREGATRATLAGAVMTAIALATGSIIPGIIVHALIDAGSGTVGYLLLRDQGSSDAEPAVALDRSMRVAS